MNNLKQKVGKRKFNEKEVPSSVKRAPEETKISTRTKLTQGCQMGSLE